MSKVFGKYLTRRMIEGISSPVKNRKPKVVNLTLTAAEAARVDKLAAADKRCRKHMVHLMLMERVAQREGGKP